MKVGVKRGSLLGRLLLATGRVPTPTLDTLMTILLARSVMAATKMGLFEALARQPLTLIGAEAKG